MQKSFTRLSLATALLIAGALPVLAQGVGTTVPGPRPAVPATTQAARPATPASAATTQALRPATPAQPGGTVRQEAPARQGAAAATGTQQAATPIRPAAPRIQ